MDDTVQRFATLFEQLGLPHEPADIARFIKEHRPIPGNMLLVEAPFWTPAQAEFLREKRVEDQADWTQLIDQLSTVLREKPEPV